MMSMEERAQVHEVVYALMRDVNAGSDGAAARVWQGLCEAGLIGVSGPEGAELLDILSAEAGARALPLPLLDAVLAVELLDDPASEDALTSGLMRPVVVFSNASDPFYEAVDDGGIADHVLVIDVEGELVALRPVIGRRDRPGFAEPAWSRVEVGVPVSASRRSRAELRVALRRRRWALCRRACGAVFATVEDARAHAITRRQFGRAIGSFGAVQQRAATMRIETLALEALFDAADPGSERENDVLATELALAAACEALPRMLFDAHHTLAASGFFDGHPAPARFRRAHSDLAHAAALGDARRSVVEALVDARIPLPSPSSEEGGDAARVREDVRDVLRRHVDDRDALLEHARRAGWFSAGWPSSLGGRDASPLEVAAISEEIRYAGAPLDRQLTAQFLIGTALVRHGSPAQQRDLLPLIADGRMRVALGYSEPESGSDLASLRTRAVRNGDEWVIDGEKIWSTYAHDSTHYWLATRTGGGERPQQGITVFLVPMDSAGIEVRPLRGLSGELSASVRLGGVRVPDSMRVGPVGDGWTVIGDALAGERADMGGVAAGLHRRLDDLVALIAGRQISAPADLAEAAAKVQAARLLARRAVGSEDPVAAPAAAVYAGELAEEVALLCMKATGPAAMVAGDDLDGGFERLLRTSIMYVVGGGTNDVLRALIARRMGLPRE